MKKGIFFLLTVFTLLSAATTIKAQNRFSVTLFAGGSTGAYELSNAGIGTANAAFRVNIGYTIFPILDAYAGYNRNAFTCNSGGFCNGMPVEFTGSGFTAGLKLNSWPVKAAWMPWLRAGLAYQTLEISQVSANGMFNNQSEAFNFNADAALGFELGTGFTIPVTEYLNIVPSFNYMRYTITAANSTESTVVILSGLAGIKYSF